MPSTSGVKQLGNGRWRLKAALLLGTLGFAVAWGGFLHSEQHRLASQLLNGQEVRAEVGEVRFSHPSGFRLTSGKSTITYHIFGSRQRGFLTVVLATGDTGLQVMSASFEDKPLPLAAVR